jgi:hypothetical protein
MSFQGSVETTEVFTFTAVNTREQLQLSNNQCIKI